MSTKPHVTRRRLLADSLATVSALALLANARNAHPAEPAASSASSGAAAHTGNAGDWQFLVGNWKVAHRRLNGRLVGSTQWDEFAGTCVNWTVLGGLGNVDDNVLELPAGTYHGMSIRTFDERTRQWSIWWVDSRTGNIEPPVRGGFANGEGTFFGDDVHDGKPVKVRFQWSKITAKSARWEQEFSPDGGQTWEMNWRMDFTRAA